MLPKTMLLAAECRAECLTWAAWAAEWASKAPPTFRKNNEKAGEQSPAFSFARIALRYAPTEEADV